jgi:hypothetical protein
MWKKSESGCREDLFIALAKYYVAVVDSRGDLDILEPLHIVSIKLLKAESKNASNS